MITTTQKSGRPELRGAGCRTGKQGGSEGGCAGPETQSRGSQKESSPRPSFVLRRFPTAGRLRFFNHPPTTQNCSWTCHHRSSRDTLTSQHNLLPEGPLHSLPQVVQRVAPDSTAPPTGPQPNLQTTVTVSMATALQGPVPVTPRSASTLPPPRLIISSAPQVPPSLGPPLPGGPAPAAGAPADPLGLQAARETPRPSLPVLESGREGDLAQLKLDNLLGADLCLSEQYKYQVLLGQIRLPGALRLAQAYVHEAAPYTSALQALKRRYRQPRHLVQTILDAPALKVGDLRAFYSFACSVQSLVGMLKTLEGQNGHELHCSSHVDRLLSKMPPAHRLDFIERCLRDGILEAGADRAYTLQDLAAWLQMKSQAEQISSQVAALYQGDTPRTG